jgi:RNA recognition motif-containing protein
VKNVDPKVTSKEFKKHFEEYGEVVSSSLRLSDTGLSLGYGYV